MKEIKTQKVPLGRPKIIDDEELIAEKMRKRHARNMDKLCAKIDQIYNNYTDMAFGEDVAPHHRLAATDKLFKIMMDFQKNALMPEETEEILEEKEELEDQEMSISLKAIK